MHIRVGGDAPPQYESMHRIFRTHDRGEALKDLRLERGDHVRRRGYRTMSPRCFGQPKCTIGRAITRIEMEEQAAARSAEERRDVINRPETSEHREFGSSRSGDSHMKIYRSAAYHMADFLYADTA